MSGENLYYTDMLDVLRAAGVQVGENLVTKGWQTRARGSGGFAAPPLGVFWHHTASRATVLNDLTYCIKVAESAPVGNGLLDRDGVFWPIAAGACNCAGKGGPVMFSRGECPQDQGNSRCWHVEVCNSGLGEPWPEVQIDAYFAVSNAMNARFGNLPIDVVTHALGAGGGYTGRKIDPSTAAAVQGPWRPRSVNNAGTWSMQDIRNECLRRATPPPEPEPTPIPPEPPEPEPGPEPTPPDPGPAPQEDDDMPFIIENRSTGEVALVYGDHQVVGLAGDDLEAYEGRFGSALKTDPVVWDGFIDKATP